MCSPDTQCLTLPVGAEKMALTKIEKFLQYGISNQLAQKAVSAGLTVTKARTLNRQDMVARFGLSQDEAKILSKAVKRAPIDPDLVHLLLERSNFVCSICRGQKSPAYIIHHIEEYEISQNNNYHNLVVLCPNDHDLAHQAGLSLKITKEQLKKSKDN
jgi:predicted HNH restriction endonuclease